MTLSFAPEAIETWPLDRLRPYARNAKTHGADQVARIAASMAAFGWTVPVLVSSDGEVIAGHGRIMAQRRAYRIADNKLTELGAWDEALLSGELQELVADEFDLSLIGFSDGELDRLLALEPGDEASDGAGVAPVVIPEPPRRCPPLDEWRAGHPVRHRPALSRRLRRLEPSDPQQGLVGNLRHHLGRQFTGG